MSSRQPLRIEPDGAGVEPVGVAPGHHVEELASCGLFGDHLARGV
ncbi:MAG TPA: hypothetical protein VE135_13470 [Pyrinomonadaceae bacterium]|nr:hypothetical protein [Pyrinomonadaceae bacterium]